MKKNYSHYKNKIINSLKPFYYETLIRILKYNLSDKKMDPMIIMIFDGTYKIGGLADRLKQIISVYAYCKSNGFPFAIKFTHPFSLSTYLDAVYNWDIDEAKFTKSLLYSKPVYCANLSTNKVKRKLFLKNKQIHVYSIPVDFYEVYCNETMSSFGKMFFELFKPSLTIENIITEYKIKFARWDNCSFRFQNLLGDFNELDNQIYYTKSISIEEQEDLICKCFAYVKNLNHRNKAILVCSDSNRFLNRVSILEHVIVIPGRLSHTDNSQEDDYELHLKTFLDFFMISESDEIERVGTNFMYPSNFSKLASLLYGKPFRQISLD